MTADIITLRPVRDTVAEVLDEVRDDAPDVLVAFSMKGSNYLVTVSNCDNVTLLIGALERMKAHLLS